MMIRHINLNLKLSISKERAMDRPPHFDTRTVSNLSWIRNEKSGNNEDEQKKIGREG